MLGVLGVFEAVVGGGHGWHSKVVMIILGVFGLFLHGLRGRNNPLPRDLGFSLK